MPRCASRHAISQLISRIIHDSGLGRSDFIRSLGYRSVPGGLRRLDRWLDEGGGHAAILARIRNVYRLDRKEVDAALVATNAAKFADTNEERDRERFRPYIHVEGESRIPSGITLFGITGGRWNVIEVPQDLARSTFADQMPALTELIRAYLRRYRGFCPFFRRVIGFRLVSVKESFRFTGEGEFVERVEGPFRRPQTEVNNWR